MKLSQITMDQLSSLNTEQIDRIVFSGKEETQEKGIAAILLGGNPLVMAERARAAAELYQRDVVPYIIPTGGVRWDTDRGNMSEAGRSRRVAATENQVAASVMPMESAVAAKAMGISMGGSVEGA